MFEATSANIPVLVESETRPSMFGALKRFITEKVVGPKYDDSAFEVVEVSDPNFWPHIIIRSRLEWRKLDYQPGI